MASLWSSCATAAQCPNSQPVVCNQQYRGGTNPTSSDPSLADCFASPSFAYSAWFHLYAKPPIAAIVVSTFGSSYDTQLSVYTGASCNRKACIARNDDHGTSLQSLVTLSLPSGGNPVHYFIAVHGYELSACFKNKKKAEHTHSPVPAVDKFNCR